MENFELVPLQNGIISLRSLKNNETFHPGIGPAEEANILHVQQQRIVERALASDDFVLWDVGLGAAANALAAIRAFQAGLGPDYQGRVTIESFDRTTKPLEFALENAKELGYIEGFESEIRQLIDTGSVRLSDRLQWNLNLGDFAKDISGLTLRAPDAIFYDPYSAKGNTEMWTLDHFSNLFSKLDPERTCLLTNYTASTYVRVTLLLAGFHVGWGCQIHKKLHTTIASNHIEALERPLRRDWLEDRVRISHSAAPIRDVPYEIAPLGEEDYLTLIRMAQFE